MADDIIGAAQAPPPPPPPPMPRRAPAPAPAPAAKSAYAEGDVYQTDQGTFKLQGGKWTPYQAPAAQPLPQMRAGSPSLIQRMKGWWEGADPADRPLAAIGSEASPKDVVTDVGKGLAVAAPTALAITNPVAAARGAIGGAAGAYGGGHVGRYIGGETGESLGKMVGGLAGGVAGARGAALPSRLSLLQKLLAGGESEATGTAAGEAAAVARPAEGTLWTPRSSAANTGLWHAGQGSVPNPEIQTPENMRLIEKLRQLGITQ
jgi:hypothetical protein